MYLNWYSSNRRLLVYTSLIMTEDLETQIEEEEALLAIYDGDPAFKRLSATVYQYVVSRG